MSVNYTICFIRRGDELLMLHRRRPPNQGLWNGVGGRLEPGEDPVTGCLREVREETGFILHSVRFAGIVKWTNDGMYVFTADAPEGEPVACDEGALAWKPIEWVFTSGEVVVNVCYYLPSMLSEEPPMEHVFTYDGSTLVGYERRACNEVVRFVS